MQSNASPAPPPARPETGRSWSPTGRLGFRFLFSYAALYLLPFDPLWRTAVPAMATRVLGMSAPPSFAMTGSGDTTYAYVQLLATITAALAATVLWSLADRRSRAYPRLSRWLAVSTRYFVGTTMLSYGLAKIIPNQFPQPTLDQLLRTYGESSPMGLVWTFMGLSPAYTIFAGLAEAGGGVLLFFRRTTTLGAAVLAAVLTNVVMLNFAYDVPVKLFSSHLLVMAVGLLLIDIRRLLAVFWSNSSMPPVLRPLFASAWANRFGRTVALLAVGFMALTTTTSNWQSYTTIGNGRPRPELWGIHDVTRFIYDGEERPPLLTDTVRWRALVVDRALTPPAPVRPGGMQPAGQIVIQHMNGRRAFHQVILDEAARTFFLRPYGSQAGSSATNELTYERSAGIVVVTGTWNGRPLEVHMQTRAPGQLLLLNRGFRWVNEVPFNR